MLASCSGGGGGSARSRGGGATAYLAEEPGATPDWILPFSSQPFYSVTNVQHFQYLMFRPLYWFGQTSSTEPTVDFALSTAYAPRFSPDDTSVTIPMKGWRWSNGTVVDARDVMFWINLERAEKSNFAGYEPGGFPDNVASYSADPSRDAVTLVLDKRYDPQWYLYDELSEITPLPIAWDVTHKGAAPGSGGCSSLSPGPAVEAACVKVWRFLSDDGGSGKDPTEAGDQATYATNPLWRVVDGPWRLEDFTPGGTAAFVPNRRYSGPARPRLSRFVEKPFASASSEVAALASASRRSPYVGYVPVGSVPVDRRGPGRPGGNTARLERRYLLSPLYDWGINYDAVNENSNGGGGKAGALLRQVYLRRALQYALDEDSMIRAIDRGYATATYGPVPLYPANPYLSPSQAKNAFPYSLKTARAILVAHGWKVMPGGTDVCTARLCGKGIPRGTRLSLVQLFYAGPEGSWATARYLRAQWAQIGVALRLVPRSFDGVLTAAVPCKERATTCSWELASWGGGFVYAPDYMPTGEEVFATGAGSNVGSYSNARADDLIAETTTSGDGAFLADYENFVQTQVPVIWEPNPALQLVEVSRSLGGVMPLNPLGTLTPEYWHLRPRHRR